MNFSEYERLIHNAFVPKILIVTTDGAESVCLKNGGKFTDLIRPYCSFPEETKTIRGIRDESYEIKGLRCQLLEPYDLKLTDDLTERTEKTLNSIIRDSIPEDPTTRYIKGFEINNRTDAIEFPTNKPISSLMPWYERYQNHFLSSLGVAEHEFFGHPVACIFVASSVHEDTDNDDLTSIFIKLYEQVLNMPGLFTEGFMDTNFLRYYVLLHDNNDDIEKAQKKLGYMKQNFGGNACILPINSLPYDQPRLVNGKNTFLSLKDCDTLKNFTKDIVYKYTIPFMETKLRSLEEQVAANRKSLFSSKVRSFFRFQSKPRQVGEGAEVTSTGLRIYPMGSNTSQTRQLADFAFMLRDYDSALLNYKNCIVEMKNDQTVRHLASATEMAAICNSLIDTQRRDPENDLEKAISLYLQGNCPRYIIRSTMILCSLKKLRNRFTEAAAIYIRSEDKNNPLLSALYQEQSAFCYLYKSPNPMHRMFNMRIVMAADKFYEAQQIEHSYGCCYVARNVYSRGWNSLTSHVKFILSRSSFLLEDLESSCSFSRELLENNTQPAERQSSYFREMIHIFKIDFEKYGSVRESPVPTINNPCVQLQCQYSCNEEKAWKLLEEWVAYETSREKARALYRPFYVPRDRSHNAFKSHVSAVYESITVDVEISNPLSFPIQLYSCQLLCDHYTIDDDVSEQGIPKNPYLSNPEETFSLEKIDILLYPEESKTTISLKVTPLKEGLIEIRGIVFNLAGIVWCTKRFPIKTRRLQNTKQHRITGAVEVDLYNSIQIVPSMPLLSIDFPKLPNQLYQGEIRQYPVTFKNTGKEPLKNVAVKLSHPGCFVFSKSSTDNILNSNPFSTTNTWKHIENHNGLINDTYDLSIIHLPIDILNPGESVTVPLWVRGHKIGTSQCKFVFYYEPVRESFIKYRVCREEAIIEVIPSVKISYWVNPSVKNEHNYTLGIQFNGLQNEIGFNLLQITSASAKWKIEPLSFSNGKNNGDIFHLEPAESSSFFLSISSCIESQEPLTLNYRNLQLIPKYNINGGSHPFDEILTRIRRPNPISFNTNFTTLRDYMPPPVTSLIEPHSMDLLLFWESPDSSIFGITELCDIHFIPCHEKLSRKRQRRKSSLLREQQLNNNNETKRFVRNSLKFLIKSPIDINFDFNSDDYCLLPVTIVICNPSFTDSVSFLLETMKPDESVRSNYFWAGCTKQTVKNLKPQQEIEIVLTAGFFTPGVYNVNKFKFLVYSPDSTSKDGKLIICPFQHLVKVNQISSKQ